MAKVSTEVEPDPAADGDIIDSLSKMNDAQLLTKFGLQSKLDKAKADLKEAKGLTGKAREIVAERIESLLAPHMYGDEIGHAIDSAKRQTAPKGKTTPTSMVEASGRWD